MKFRICNINLRNHYIMSVMSKSIIIVITFLTSIIINRYLQPDLKGEYSYIMNWVAIIALILNLGIGQSVSFFKRKHGETIVNMFVNIYYLQLMMYLLIVFSLNFFYTNKILNLILIISSLAQFNSQLSFLSIIQNINKRNITAISSTIIHLIILVYIFFATSKNLNLIIIAYVLKISVDSIIMIIKNSFYPTFNNLKLYSIYEIIRFGFFPMITSLLITFNYNLDIIILKSFVSFEKIGLYSVGVTLAGMLWILPDAFKDVLFNKTSKSDSISDIQFSIKFNIYFSLVVIVGFVILGKSFISLFYGDEYISSYSVSILLMMGGLPMIYFKMINTLFISIGKQKFAFAVLFCSVLINIILNFILIPIYNINGAAAASLVSYSVSGFVFLFSFMKDYNLSIKNFIFFSSLERQKIKRLFGSTNKIEEKNELT